jgi:nitroreductase
MNRACSIAFFLQKSGQEADTIFVSSRGTGKDGYTMDVKDAIIKRKSIRKYDGTAIPPHIIEEVLDAARRAPSGRNAQPWRFLVVRDRQTMEVLKQHKAFPQPFVYKAPVLIICCGDPSAYTGKYGGVNLPAGFGHSADANDMTPMFTVAERTPAERAMRDVSIASSFMVLRATELGLGTSYIGLIDQQALRTVLAIPEGLLIFYVVIMGYSTHAPLDTKRKTLQDILVRPL